MVHPPLEGHLELFLSGYCTSRFYSCLSQNPPPRFLLYQLVFPKRTQQSLHKRPIRFSIFRLPSDLCCKIRKARSRHLHHRRKKLSLVLLSRVFRCITFLIRDRASDHSPNVSPFAVLELVGLADFEAKGDRTKVNAAKLALPVKFRDQGAVNLHARE